MRIINGVLRCGAAGLRILQPLLAHMVEAGIVGRSRSVGAARCRARSADDIGKKQTRFKLFADFTFFASMFRGFAPTGFTSLFASFHLLVAASAEKSTPTATMLRPV